MKTQSTLILILALLSGACAKEATHSAEASEAQALDPEAKAAIVAAQLASYPLDTCPVSEDSLGSMGDPIDYVYEGRLVRFCCDGCIGSFEKDPGRYLALIDAAAAGEGK